MEKETGVMSCVLRYEEAISHTCRGCHLPKFEWKCPFGASRRRGAPAEEVDDAGEVGKGEIAADMVHQLGQHGEGKRPQLCLALPPTAHQRLLLQQRLQLAQETCANNHL